MSIKDSTNYEVRSKNAGPFWLTIDIFCGDARTFEQLCEKPQLQPLGIAELMQINETSIMVFQIAALNVIKISLPRPVVQGSLSDRDMHGASWAYLLQEKLQFS